MTDENNSNNNSEKPKKVSEELTEEKRKELIEKIKAGLYLENSENSILYASLLKVNIA